MSYFDNGKGYRPEIRKPGNMRFEAHCPQPGDVFLRADFHDLGGYDQVGRALRGLIRKGRLIKLGYGLYCRAVKSPLNDEPVPRKGLESLTNR